MIKCRWCETVFAPRNTGGSKQKFCSKICKRYFENSILNWANAQYDKGAVNRLELQCMRSLKGGL